MPRSPWLFMIFCAAAAWGQAGPQSQSDVVAEALKNNPGIAAARLHVTEAQGRVAELAAARGFQLTFSGTASGSSGQVAQPSSIQSFRTIEGDLIAPIPNLGR